ncbi:MAG: 5-(carboxyamino)imidazole ribonucleotide synthase [Pseudobdellovibrionaceae bacterium]
MSKSNITPVLGIVGGGQLGRMSAMAAARLGIKCIIYNDAEECPARDVAYQTIVGAYDDKAALEEFARACDVITYEFENIPVETVRFLNETTPVYPDAALLEVSQHRCREKDYLNKSGATTTSYLPVHQAEDIAKAFTIWGDAALILKTSRFGYDGKGQIKVKQDDDYAASIAALGSDDLIAEKIVPFDHEISVIVARDADGGVLTYEPSLNHHENHILKTSTVPAKLPPALLEKARQMAATLAENVQLRGVMGVEFFVTKDGAVLANEIAPRPHNSGHWTIDACSASQFEQHVRAAVGWPVAPVIRHSDAVMTNLLGAEILDVGKSVEQSGYCVHNYGKASVKEGRKMGHVTQLYPLGEL